MKCFIRTTAFRVLAACVAALCASGASGQAKRTFSFAYDQPTSTAYGIAVDIFDAKLKELSASSPRARRSGDRAGVPGNGEGFGAGRPSARVA